MTLGSCFDGLGGWQLAAVRAGIKPVWSSEIDKLCLAITRRHFPNTIQLGDLNKIGDAPEVDIITSGSPCQSFSIAGKREGLKGASGLFIKAVELVRRINPRYFVWENVPGVLSSNGGLDFKTVLEEILQEPVPLFKGWSNAGLVDGRKCQVAWRILDAQYWGVPQRRKRIFLVADFRGQSAAEILFERKSMCRDTSSSQSKERGTTNGIGKGSTCSIGFDIDATFAWAQKEMTPTQKTTTNLGVAVFDMTHASEVLRQMTGDKANCLNARMGTGGNQVPLVAYGLKLNATCDNTRELQPTLRTAPFACVATKTVRRLTPTECERLQGLPEGWTVGGSDTARYKAIGNGMVQPIADWIMQRIKEMSE